MEEEVPSFHQVINELISSTYFIATLPFKWQAIRDKLEKLNWILKSAPYSGEFVKDSLLPKLLRDMSTALTEIRLLADHCGDGSYNGGKLLMKSDIDKASSRLDILIKNFTEFYGSGFPMDSNAILVAKPANGASRDDMKFYMEELFLRLRIGDLEMKASALEAINKILIDDEKYIMILVMEVDNGIQVLVSLLELSDVSLQEEALAAILIIAGFNSYKGALVTAGVVGPLVRILEAGSKLGKVRSGWTLKNLTENSDNVWSVSANGGVTALINLIEDVESCTELIYPICEVLQNLCNVIEIKRFMVEEGVISVFLELLDSKEEAIRIRAIEFLTAIASNDHGIKEEIVRGGGATYKLLKFLNPSTSHSMKEREVSLRAMEQCCFSSTNSINVLIGTRLISWVMFFLNKGDISIQEVALQAMLSLCEASEEAKKAMGESGFMSVIVKLLDAKSSKACELAAELLVKLVSVQKNRRRFINEEQNVNRILELLNPGEDAKEAKKYLLPLLSSLSTSNSGRRKIAASGYAKNLERLAQIDVIDAKKIVKKITCSRLRSLMKGIWSF
ncbi:uncharacterized protein LOC110097123 [Dendrobium catenatum]|uniref:U-box domain-containing protein 13 n=1 Tax=Dendrobium catenatum TaxID=906689 RepID=A0A2I0W2U2_9ASPA|nr:uncharacterized protein LOC110097123 [Dendrobium catenatum]PKU69976.1 U-box domain-containing protein 13 [Dendrobium catenatum]